MVHHDGYTFRNIFGCSTLRINLFFTNQNCFNSSALQCKIVKWSLALMHAISYMYEDHTHTLKNQLL